MRQQPEKIVQTQNSHRQSVPDTPMKPPTMGPRAGPAKGAMAKMAIASPRVFGPQMSAMTAPELVKGEAPKAPLRKRKIRIEAVLGLSAHPTFMPV